MLLKEQVRRGKRTNGAALGAHRTGGAEILVVRGVQLRALRNLAVINPAHEGDMEVVHLWIGLVGLESGHAIVNFKLILAFRGGRYIDRLGGGTGHSRVLK